MNGRVLRFDASAHRRADLLLPWLVNGTLDGEELDFVRHHVDACPRCRREVEWLRELGVMCADARARGDASAAIARPPRRVTRVRAVWRNAASRVARAWRRSERWTRWAIAAQFCVIVFAGAAWVATRDSPALYQTLGSTSTSPGPAGSVIVVFDPQTTEGEMSRIVGAATARIIDGPVQDNAYVLSLPQDRVDEALSMLRSQRAVLLAAPWGPLASHRR